MSLGWSIIAAVFIAYVIAKLGQIAANTRRIADNTAAKVQSTPELEAWANEVLRPNVPKVSTVDWVKFALLCVAGPLLLLWLALR